MCCFSGPVQEVSRTKIFARRFGKASQYLVYQMQFKSLEDLAMILPLPTPEDAPEDALTFINLEGYTEFFRDMRKGFPVKITRSAPSRKPAVASAPPEPKLEVVEIGSFEASFVPKLADFRRLDQRFRLPDDAWEKLPQYKSYGFAVFKLKKGNRNVHPMAFAFPTRLRDEIFFPTVHIHDGEVHDRAEFDHDLYLQCAGDEQFVGDMRWRESEQPAGMFLDAKKAGSLIRANAHAYHLRLRGELKNADTLV